MTDMVGKILHNRYKILHPVGVGGMGLSDMVDDRQISEILQAHQTAEAAEVLLEAALDNGGRDNISLILIDLTPTEEDNRS